MIRDRWLTASVFSLSLVIFTIAGYLSWGTVKSDPATVSQINLRRFYYSHPLLAAAFENKLFYSANLVWEDVFRVLNVNRYLFSAHPREGLPNSPHPQLGLLLVLVVFVLAARYFRPFSSVDPPSSSHPPGHYLVATLVILGLGLFLRLYNLAASPPGVYVDDAAQGYNAYSLALTGRDEYGYPFPVFLRSFGTYPSALAAYYLVPSVRLLGLSPFSIRLPLALLGAVVSLAFALLCTRLFPQARFRSFVLGGLIFATLPSHILFSRAFFESPLSLALFLVGILTFFRRRWVLSALFLSLSAYAYHPQRLLAPLAVISLTWLYRSLLGRRYLGKFITVFTLTTLPLLYFSTLPGPNHRSSISWLDQVRSRSSTPLQLAGRSVKEYASQFLAYYNPAYLFWYPDSDLQRSLPDLSVYYPWLVAPYLAGWLVVLSRPARFRPILVLAALAPAVAALTRDPFAVLRASLVLIPASLLIVAGLLKLWSHVPRFVTWSAGGILLTLSLFHLTRSLFVLLPAERYTIWQYGYDQLFSGIVTSGLPAVVDTDKPVYILYLFYRRISPELVQAQSPILPASYYANAPWSDYYSDTHVSFRRLNWLMDPALPQLIAGSDLLISPSQSREHFFDLAIPVFSPFHHQLILAAWQTHPRLVCAAPGAEMNPYCVKP